MTSSRVMVYPQAVTLALREAGPNAKLKINVSPPLSFSSEIKPVAASAQSLKISSNQNQVSVTESGQTIEVSQPRVELVLNDSEGNTKLIHATVYSSTEVLINGTPEVVPVLNGTTLVPGDTAAVFSMNGIRVIGGLVNSSTAKFNAALFAGQVAMGGNKITGLGAPTATTDATTKTYVDTADGLKLNRSGGTMTGDLDMGGNDIIGVAAGSEAAPSISFTGDNDTGFYVPFGNGLDVTTGGTKKMRWGTSTTHSYQELNLQSNDIVNVNDIDCYTLIADKNLGADATSVSPLQAGPTSSTNVAIGNNAIQARNNGSTSTLHLNYDGGNVVVGGGGSGDLDMSGNDIIDVDQIIANVVSTTVPTLTWAGYTTDGFGRYTNLGPSVLTNGGWNVIWYDDTMRVRYNVSTDDGSVSAPAIRQWDTDVGMYWVSGGGRLCAGGVDALSWTNVGVWSPVIYSTTTGSAANVYVNSLGRMFRSTSARKYKDKIKPLTLAESQRVVFGVEAVSYKSKCKGDKAHEQFVGIIADPMVDIDKRFVTFGEDDEVEAFNYERMPAPLAVVASDHETRIVALEAAIESLKGSIPGKK